MEDFNEHRITVITWKDLISEIDLLVSQIDFPVKTVVGIVRGGVIPAMLIAQRLNVTFDTLLWQTRDGYHQDHMKAMTLNDPETLFIDDLIDSGITIESIRELAPDSKFGTIHAKTDTVLLDICAKPMYNDDTWILYPWEANI